jgi:hypothetical protein
MFQANVNSFYQSFKSQNFKLYKFLEIELRQLTGIAAILRFPMPDIEDLSDSDDDDAETETKFNGHICNNIEADEEVKPKTANNNLKCAEVTTKSVTPSKQDTVNSNVSTNLNKAPSTKKNNSSSNKRFLNKENVHNDDDDYDMFDFNATKSTKNSCLNYDDDDDYL